jgi:uncharacterized membrane protein
MLLRTGLLGHFLAKIAKGAKGRRVFAVLLAVAALHLASPVQAQFAVCNQTLNVLNIAIGRYQYEDFVTSGWWTVGPNRCANVIDEELDVRFVYVFAQDVFGKVIMSGATPMCVGPKRFDITGNEDCLLRGFLEARFHEVDTFKSERWTLFIYPPS